MILASLLEDRLDALLARSGKHIVRSEWLYDWQRHKPDRPVFYPSVLPPGAADYLRRTTLA